MISQLQSVGEDALGRIAKTDAARSSAIQRATELKDRAGKTLAGSRGDREAARRDRGAARRPRGSAERRSGPSSRRRRGAKTARRRATGQRREAEGRGLAPERAAAARPADLEPRRRRPGLLAVELDRQRLRRVDRRATRCARTSTCGGRRGRRRRASARSSRSRASTTSPIRTTSNSAVVGAGVRRELHPAAVPAARSRRSRRASRPRRSPPSKRTVTSVFCQARNSRDERVVERRPAAERLRHRVRAPRDRAAHPDRADVREEPRRLRPSAPRKVGAADVDRAAASRRARPAPRRRSRSGSRASDRSPGRCRSGGPRPRRPVPAMPFTTSFIVPSPPTTTSRSALGGGRARQLGQVARAAPRGARRRRARAPARARCSFGPALRRRAVRARRVDEEDGLFAHAKAPRVRDRDVEARAASSGRRRPSARRRVIRVNAPSTTMSLTVSRQRRLDAAERGDGEERRGLHLDARARRATPSARTGPRSGCRRGRSRRSGRRAARCPLCFAMCTASCRSDHDAVGQCGSLPTRCIAVESAGTALSATIRSPSAWLGLQAAAGADADQLLAAELDQLLEDDRRARAAHAGALHRDRLALPGAGEAEQAALAVSLHGRRRSTSRRCTWRAAGRREGEQPRRTRRARRGRGSAWRGTLACEDARIARDGDTRSNPASTRCSSSARATRSSACSSRTSPAAGFGRFLAVEDDDGDARLALPPRREPRPVGQRLRGVRGTPPRRRPRR